MQKVSQEQLEKELADRQVPLIIDFYATWCGPCVLLAKELEQVICALLLQLDVCAPWYTHKHALQQPCDKQCNLQVANELGDKVKVLKIDTDENPELSTQLQVCNLADKMISMV